MSRSWRWHLLSAGVVLILVVFGAADFVTSNSADSKGKQVTSALEANWAHTSLLAETSEFLTADDPAAFWTFIDTLIAGANAAEREGQLSAEREFEQSIALAAPLLGGADGSSISLLRFALALRLHSPRVELHRQIARDVLRGANRTLGDVKAFYEINGAVGVEAGEELANLLDSAAQRTPSAIYSVDHVHPVSSTSRHSPVVAILYANVGADSSHFAALHSELARYAQEGRARYAFRHFDASIFGEQQPTESSVLPRVSLSGYGVELAIKSTEYKAIDDSNVKSAASEDEPAPQDLHGFNFSALREKHSHLKGELHQFQLHLAELDELSPLKQWEIADIGLQAAQRIMDATPEEALSLLVDLSQNFPIRARKLAQTRVRPSFRGEIVQNQQRWAQQLELGEGESALFLNGIPVASGAEVEQLDLFQLFQTLRQEQRLAEAFAQMGLRRDYGAVLKVMELGEERAGGYALDYREGKPEWMNNLDKDKIYADWGNSVRLLLQPYFPGMIRPIARNLFSLVALIDPGSPASWPLIKIAFTLYSHQVPLRIGFIFAIDDAPGVDGKNNLGVALHNVFQFVKADKGPPKAVHFLKKMIEELTEGGAALELEHVHAYFKRHYTDQEVDDVFGPESDYGAGRGEGIAFFRRSGLQKLPALLVNGVPLDSGLLQSADRIEEGIVMQVMRQTSTLQRAVISGKLTDRENVQNWLMSQPDVLPRLNTRLIGSAEQQQNGGAPKSMVPPFHSSAPCGQSSAEQRTQCMVAQARYLTRADEGAKSGDEPCWSTVWVVADLDSPDGRQLLQNALRALKKSNEMRLAVVHNGKQQKSGKAAKMVDALLNGFSSTAAKQALNKLLTSEELTAELESNGARPVLDKIAGHGVSAERVVAELNSPNGTLRLMRQWQFAQRELGLAPGQRAVVANGQVFGPLSENEQLELEDFGLLEKLAEKRGAKAVAALVKQWRKNGKKEANGPDTVFRILSAVNAFAVRKRRLEMETELDLESVLNLLADEEGGRPVLEISAVVDPLSRAAQKLAPILQALLRVVNADLRLAMNPKLRLSELPLKRFYRFVLSDEPTFSANGTLLPQIALFRELPQKQLLTMNLQVPDAWMVQPVKAEYDLDNIRVAAASSDIVAHFQLRHILLEGHCFDDQSGNPPRGLQFVLGTPTNPVLYDTIVMANLGYFQLKAGPGAWILRLREGRSRQIYELKNSVDAESIAPGSSTVEEETNVVEELHVLVDSFSGRTIRVRVSKRKGMEKRNLLTEDESGKKTEEEEQMDVEEIGEEAEEEGGDSIWSNLAPKKVVKKLSSKLMGKSGGPAHDRINIFSLASGHLYERFLRIMMLSVLKNTKHPVKFWLLNNYLSPQFRESLPMMAANYGFDYQLIEYKWPRWLHQQTEKQRVMWGYKILFLDVLFPLDVKKIIFVDADQIVRADMMELMEHDLGGAPYGYTPFCDSRTSMDGFRFWKSGYWASHLAGRRYHISALYVVDLVKFRQIAAGDRLRGQYQGLSADPNSLSNLDQDLPNNMIHQVRIHSLPQEWLWCETWCDDVSKKSAKTIDLCNNPQTKEPKLDSAMRIVPEWVDYDNEIKQLLTDVSATSTAGDVKPATIKEEESAEIGEGGEPQHSEL